MSSDVTDDRTRLALSRTRMALDRTLMAWIRTATSLISFGFTIYKFFQYMREGQTGPPIERVVGPREVALVMISLGVVALFFATLEYRAQRRTLRERYGAGDPMPPSVAQPVAAAISGLGILGFVLVFLRQ